VAVVLREHMFQRHPVQNNALMLITTNTSGRSPVFAEPAHAREAVECLYRVQSLYPFFLYGFVMMPDHCHSLLRVDPPLKVSQIMNSYKSGLTFDIGIPKLWQSRFHIRIVENGAGNVLQYIHMNPVIKNLADRPESYPWSSANGKWDVCQLPA
jgi:putative transposase